MQNMRRQFFIDKPFQSKYGAYVALTLLVTTGICAVGLYFGILGSVIESFSDANLYNEIQMAARIQDYEHAREPAQPSKLSSLRLFREVNLLSERQIDILEHILKRANKTLLWQSFLLIILIGCGSIFLTHKIAGPFYRFRKAFEAVKKGELNTRIHLRKNDEGMHVAESFNEMIGTLDNEVANLKKITRTAGSAELKPKLENELSKFKTTTS